MTCTACNKEINDPEEAYFDGSHLPHCNRKCSRRYDMECDHIVSFYPLEQRARKRKDEDVYDRRFRDGRYIRSFSYVKVKNK
jgi:hypothetical protein